MFVPYREWAEDVGTYRMAEARCVQCQDWSDLTLRGDSFFCRNQWNCLTYLSERKRDLEREVHRARRVHAA